MADIGPDATGSNVPRAVLAARLAAVRAELTAVISAPYAFGCEGPHRRRRDIDILQTIAADARARLVEAAT